MLHLFKGNNMILAMDMLEKEIIKVKATVEMLRMCGESKRMISRMNQVNRLQAVLDLLENEYYDIKYCD